MYMSETNNRLVFGDPTSISLVKRKQQTEIRKLKITIGYDKLIQVGLSDYQAEDLLTRLINFKKRK